MGDEKRPISYVANFVALIALFFVLYIIILPSGEKAKLVDDSSVIGTGTPALGNTGSVGTSGSAYENVRTLLVESPGIVRPFTEEVGAQPISSVKLFTNQETDVSTIASSLLLKKSVFSSYGKNAIFNIDNLDDIESANLYFLVVDQKGRLKVYLNNELIYNSIVNQNALPIKLPKDSLRERNTLTLEAESPGFKFLTTNYVELKDVQVVKKFNVANKVEQRSFMLTESEASSITKASLNYFINCLTVGEAGALNIYLNERLASTRFVVCDARPVFLDLDTSYMQTGRNVIKFEIDRGDYVIEQILLQKLYEQKGYPIFFFPVQGAEAIALEDGAASAALFMKFKDDGFRKKATVLVNGVPVYLDTYSNEFAFDVSDFLIEGENFVKVMPNTEFEVLDLEVALR